MIRAVALLVAAVIAAAVVAYASPAAVVVSHETVSGKYGGVEHHVEVKTPSGHVVEVNISTDRVEQNGVVAVLHYVEVDVNGEKLVVRGTKGECELNVMPEEVQERVREQFRARVVAMKMEEHAVVVNGEAVTRPVYVVHVEHEARFLGIVPVTIDYDVYVDPETGEVLYRGPFWLVLFVR